MANPAEPSPPGDRVAKLRCPPAGCASPSDGLGDHDGQLGGQQDAQDLAGDVDAQLAQDGDQRPGDQRPHPPRLVHVQVRGGLGLRGRAQRPVQAGLQERVGDQRDQRGGDPDGAAQAAGDEGVEGAGVGDVPAHRHVPGGEDRQDHRDDQERGGDAGQPGRRERGGDHPGGDGQRRDPGQDEEQHGRDAEPVAGQGPRYRAGPAWCAAAVWAAGRLGIISS